MTLIQFTYHLELTLEQSRSIRVVMKNFTSDNSCASTYFTIQIMTFKKPLVELS